MPLFIPDQLVSTVNHGEVSPPADMYDDVIRTMKWSAARYVIGLLDSHSLTHSQGVSVPRQTAWCRVPDYALPDEHRGQAIGYQLHEPRREHSYEGRILVQAGYWSDMSHDEPDRKVTAARFDFAGYLPSEVLHLDPNGQQIPVHTVGDMAMINDTLHMLGDQLRLKNPNR